MKITVQAMGLTPHQPLEEYIEKKLGKLDTFYDKIKIIDHKWNAYHDFIDRTFKKDYPYRDTE